MTLSEVARLKAFCTRCGKRGGHQAMEVDGGRSGVIRCTCGHSWQAYVAMCDVGPAPTEAPTKEAS